MQQLFNISRIRDVEVTADPWTNAFDHKELQVDSSHMTGERKIHVVLMLDNMASNLLVEEFEGSENELTDKKDAVGLLKSLCISWPVSVASTSGWRSISQFCRLLSWKNT